MSIEPGLGLAGAPQATPEVDDAIALLVFGVGEAVVHPERGPKLGSPRDHLDRELVLGAVPRQDCCNEARRELQVRRFGAWKYVVVRTVLIRSSVQLSSCSVVICLQRFRSLRG